MHNQRPTRRLLGNLLIVAGALILIAAGVLIAREQARRRATLAQLAQIAALATATPAATATPLSPTATFTAEPTSTRAPATTAPTLGMTVTPPPAATATSAPSATPTPLPPTVAPTATPSPARLVRIVAPAINLDAPVVEVGWKLVAENGQMRSEWETASFAAGHHLNSRLPGQGGNIVLSGHHNIEGEVFKRVVDLKEGDAVTLYSEDGRSFTYRVTERMIVLEVGASDAERQAHAQCIGETADERLTLITCWPYWTNTHRVIVIARPATP